MARVTVEDCIDRVKNRFELVLATAHRSREISSGAEPHVERDNDKNPVIALREVADGKVLTEDLVEGVIKGMQHQVEVDEPEEDEFSSLLGDSEGSQDNLRDNFTDSDAEKSGMNIHGISEGGSQNSEEPLTQETEINLEKVFNFEDISALETEDSKEQD